jgi:hypothetical protein
MTPNHDPTHTANPDATRTGEAHPGTATLEAVRALEGLRNGNIATEYSGPAARVRH